MSPLPLRALSFGWNLRLRDCDQTPREFAHLLKRRLGFRRWLGHEMNLGLRRPIVAYRHVISA